MLKQYMGRRLYIMGLIKAAAGAFGGTMADQWKEFFYCDAIDKDVLVVKGEKRVSGRSSNKKGNDNIISSGSGIAVADGQCMIIVEQGKVVEVCAEPSCNSKQRKSISLVLFWFQHNGIILTITFILNFYTFRPGMHHIIQTDIVPDIN